MLREIAVAIGVQADGAELKGFMGLVDQAKNGLQNLGKALAGGAFLAFAKSTIDAADDLGDTADKVGVTADELQRLQYALKLTGSSTEAASQALFLFQKNLGESAEKGGGPFAELGISVKDAKGQIKSASQILPEVADKVAKAGSEAEKTALATKFFGKSAKELLPLLKRGREGLQELNDEFDDLGGGISGEVIEAAGAFNDNLDRMGLTLRAAGSQLIGTMLPVLNFLAKILLKVTAYISYLAKNTNVFKVGLAALSLVLAVKFIPMLLEAGKAFMALRTTIMGTTLPLWLVIGAFVVLFLLFEDLFTLMTGGDSLIGELLDKFGGVGAKAKLVDTLKLAWENLKKVWDQIKPALDAIWKSISDGTTSWIPALAKAFAVVIEGIVAGLTAITAAVKSIADLPAAIKSGDWSKIEATTTNAKNAIFGKSNSYWDPKTGQMVHKDVGGLFGTSEANYQKELQTAGVVTNNVEAKTTVTINAANLSPEQAMAATTKGVQGAVGSSTTQAYNAVATGVDSGPSTDKAPWVK